MCRGDGHIRFGIDDDKSLAKHERLKAPGNNNVRQADAFLVILRRFSGARLVPLAFWLRFSVRSMADSLLVRG
jgi:hypothetical protein